MLSWGMVVLSKDLYDFLVKLSYTLTIAMDDNTKRLAIEMKKMEYNEIFRNL